MSFSAALKSIDEGFAVRRKCWPEGTFIFKRIPSVINKEIVPKMTSIPDRVKEIFSHRLLDQNAQINAIYFGDQMEIVNESNLIKAYNPSVEDCFATDWGVY